MGSEFGYAYDFRLSMVSVDEINSKYKSELKDGVKTFLFEFRTNFILKKKRPENVDEEEAAEVIIDSERFDAYIHPTGNEKRDLLELSVMSSYRLSEYWMTRAEIHFLLNETLDFTRSLVSDPQYVSLNPIPVVVYVEVHTVQQKNETLNNAMDRAIRAEHLAPLYLWPQPTIVESGEMCSYRLSYLRGLTRVRVENAVDGLALMPICPICKRCGRVGSQITTLPGCGHAFHSHCVIRWIASKEKDVCPSCRRRAFPFP
ncbi:hypothetical protein CASFOL_024569 [Castilleja foliolosa]|uniref:RING-type domain-containing protein n=1 Tax=Castilleja foliolosa TaxID=1961234 RepID=A0ABD3CS97_9LAMI